MATNSNMGVHHGAISSSAFSRHAISFQTGAVNSSAGIITTGVSGGMNNSPGMIFPSNPGMINNVSGVISSGCSSSDFLLDAMSGLKHDTGLAVDWSIEEQSILEEGLAKYGDEPNIMRYIKIAAKIPNKTVRDVALRCRWMNKNYNGKRRKPEEQYSGKKMKDRKEKLVESSSKATLPPPFAHPNMAAYPFLMHRSDHSNQLTSEVPVVSGWTRHLLDENIQVFNQIAANLATYNLQENIDLFCRTRNNIVAILNNMREMPGIMSQMPPLPVSINEELADAILPSSVQTLIFGGPSSMSSGGIQLKQEPRC
ncbi:uncharacterized protein [Aristolochia californica]|uniref:uncharacterized protein n=1 Tax=Aristolochia californica TaxID=171875 RepID=UPI0035D7FD1B